MKTFTSIVIISAIVTIAIAKINSDLEFASDIERFNYYNSKCQSGMQYSENPYWCEYTCTSKGVKIDCKKLEGPGCVCPFEKYYNTQTKSCSHVECENLDCIGRQNEAFYHCESGSRESCSCSQFVTLDCRTGCQCKNGFCRNGDSCVPRTCKGSPFE